MAPDFFSRIGGLGADAEPVLGTIVIHLDFSRMGHGIVVTDLLDEAAVTGAADISNHNTVERLFLHTHSLQTNFDRHLGILLKNIL